MAEKTTTLEPFDNKHAHTLLAMAGQWLDYISELHVKPELNYENLMTCLGSEGYHMGIFRAVARLVESAQKWEGILRETEARAVQRVKDSL